MQLVDGHIYRDKDGKVFQAVKPEDPNNSVTFGLFRINVYNRRLVYPIVAGSLVGYTKNEQGLWHAMRVGDPRYTKKRIAMSPYSYFEEEIVADLQHVADNLNDYLKGL